MPKKIAEKDVYGATLTQLTAKGYRSATMGAIAEQAGVNEATLFRRYKSKAELIASASKWALANSPIAALVQSDNIKDDLERIAEAHIDTAIIYGPLLPVLIMEIAHHPELRKPVASALSSVAQVEVIMLHHQSAGRLMPLPLQTLTHAFISPLLAPFVFAYAFGASDRIEMPDPVTHVQAFLRGYGSV